MIEAMKFVKDAHNKRMQADLAYGQATDARR
jgi:hypothetical protein